MAASPPARPGAQCQLNLTSDIDGTHKLGGELLDVRNTEQAHPQYDLALQDANGLDNPSFPVCLSTGQEEET